MSTFLFLRHEMISSIATVASTTANPGGWLYNLLVKMGVSRSTAHSMNTLLVRPAAVIAVLLLAFLVAHFGSRAIRAFLGKAALRAARISDHQRAHTRIHTVVGLLANLWRFIIALTAIAICLGIVGIDLTPLLASATVIGATIGFGAQSLVRDFLSGILLTMEDQFGIGDTISVDDIVGIVEAVTMRVTRLRSDDGQVWYIPNGDIRRLANASRGWARAVVDISVPRERSASLQQLKAAVKIAAVEVAARDEFSDSCREAPAVLGIVAADVDTCTIRVVLRTSPELRVPLERALLEASIGVIADRDAGSGDSGQMPR